MSEFVPDFHHFQNFWIEQQKNAKHMDKDAAWAHIEGFIKAHWDKKEIVLGFYGYDDSGRYSYKRIYSLDGRFIRNTGEIERE